MRTHSHIRHDPHLPPFTTRDALVNHSVVYRYHKEHLYILEENKANLLVHGKEETHHVDELAAVKRSAECQAGRS
jgi:hypothetical protein